MNQPSGAFNLSDTIYQTESAPVKNLKNRHIRLQKLSEGTLAINDVPVPFNDNS